MWNRFGIYRNEKEEELIKNLDLINIACGFHAGDPEILRDVVKIAKKYKVLVGIHSSYPDLIGFGRRSIKMNPNEIENMIIYQLGVVFAFLKVENMVLNHLKPHGAFYDDSVKDEKNC